MKRYPSDRAPVSERAVAEALSSAGIEVLPEHARVLAAHASAVLEANRRFNLTAIRDPERFVALHIVDSLAVLRVAEEAPAGSGIDIGTGAGYPGLPIAVVTGRDFTLLDATSKKAAFLREACERLGLINVQAIPERAEEFALKRPAAFALAVSRAVGSLATVVELAAPLLALGGRLVAYKGRPEEDEILQGDQVAEVCGMRRTALVRYELPGLQTRSALVYTRVSEPRVSLPRRPGMAARKPLA